MSKRITTNISNSKSQEFVALDKFSLLGNAARFKIKISRRKSSVDLAATSASSLSVGESFAGSPVVVGSAQPRVNVSNNGVPNCVGTWSAHEQRLFERGLSMYGRDWKRIRELILTRTLTQIRSHAQVRW
jgi:SHAQKYF class myb-like DNA-binding protein